MLNLIFSGLTGFDKENKLIPSEKRKVFMEILLPYIPRAKNWDEAVMNMLGV
jgi:hypothetical protein